MHSDAHPCAGTRNDSHDWRSGGCRQLLLNKEFSRLVSRRACGPGYASPGDEYHERRRAAMSQQMVGIVIDRLLTDEDLRIRFIVEPVETMADLHARGFELTPDEIDLFIQTNTRTWLWTDMQSGLRTH
jgi:hypothetical protein